jgi:hypothetical protein
MSQILQYFNGRPYNAAGWLIAVLMVTWWVGYLVGMSRGWKKARNRHFPKLRHGLIGSTHIQTLLGDLYMLMTAKPVSSRSQDKIISDMRRAYRWLSDFPLINNGIEPNPEPYHLSIPVTETLNSPYDKHIRGALIDAMTANLIGMAAYVDEDSAGMSLLDSVITSLGLLHAFEQTAVRQAFKSSTEAEITVTANRKTDTMSIAYPGPFTRVVNIALKNNGLQLSINGQQQPLMTLNWDKGHVRPMLAVFNGSTDTPIFAGQVFGDQQGLVTLKCTELSPPAAEMSGKAIADLDMPYLPLAGEQVYVYSEQTQERKLLTLTELTWKKIPDSTQIVLSFKGTPASPSTPTNPVFTDETDHFTQYLYADTVDPIGQLIYFRMSANYPNVIRNLKVNQVITVRVWGEPKLGSKRYRVGKHIADGCIQAFPEANPQLERVTGTLEKTQSMLDVERVQIIQDHGTRDDSLNQLIPPKNPADMLRTLISYGRTLGVRSSDPAIEAVMTELQALGEKMLITLDAAAWGQHQVVQTAERVLGIKQTAHKLYQAVIGVLPLLTPGPLTETLQQAIRDYAAEQLQRTDIPSMSPEQYSDQHPLVSIVVNTVTSMFNPPLAQVEELRKVLTAKLTQYLYLLEWLPLSIGLLARASSLRRSDSMRDASAPLHDQIAKMVSDCPVMGLHTCQVELTEEYQGSRQLRVNAPNATAVDLYLHRIGRERPDQPVEFVQPATSRQGIKTTLNLQGREQIITSQHPEPAIDDTSVNAT